MAVTVRNVYLTDLVRVPPHAMLADVERELLSGSGDEAFVVDQNGRLLGLVPDYELLKLRMLNLHDVGAAADVMTPCPLSVTPDTPLAEAACHLRMHVHRCLPVLENGTLVGRVTRRSILDVYTGQSESALDLPPRLTPGRPKYLDAAAARTGTKVDRVEDTPRL